MIEKIPFTFLGFELLEPMAFVSNAAVTIVCAFGVGRSHSLGLTKWMLFFLSFAIASFSGALSHLFWNYWGFAGKIAPWFFGVIASGFLTLAMFDLFGFKSRIRQWLSAFVVLKGGFVLFMAYKYWNFLFVAIDTILSLFLACGVGTFILYFKYKRKDLWLMLVGFLVMLPSAFVFLFRIDVHLWLNREDLSHFLIAMGLYFFVLNLKQIRNNDATVDLIPSNLFSDNTLAGVKDSDAVSLK